MRILIVDSDAHKCAEVKHRIEKVLGECELVDNNPLTHERKGDLTGERVQLISVKDNHQIQTIFRRNRTARPNKKQRLVIKLDDGLDVLGIKQGWSKWCGSIGVVCKDSHTYNNTLPFINGLNMEPGGNRVTWFTDYNTAYASSDIIIVIGDIKYTTKANDRFKTVK